MSYYHDYLKVMAQLTESNRASILVEGREIWIEKGDWCIVTKIFNGDGAIPPAVKECVSASKLLRWPDRVQLKIEGGSVFLVQEVHPLSHFQTFKAYITQFLSLAQEWQEIVEDFSSAVV